MEGYATVLPQAISKEFCIVAFHVGNLRRVMKIESTQCLSSCIERVKHKFHFLDDKIDLHRLTLYVRDTALRVPADVPFGKLACVATCASRWPQFSFRQESFPAAGVSPRAGDQCDGKEIPLPPAPRFDEIQNGHISGPSICALPRDILLLVFSFCESSLPVLCMCCPLFNHIITSSHFAHVRCNLLSRLKNTKVSVGSPLYWNNRALKNNTESCVENSFRMKLSLLSGCRSIVNSDVARLASECAESGWSLAFLSPLFSINPMLRYMGLWGANRLTDSEVAQNFDYLLDCLCHTDDPTLRNFLLNRVSRDPLRLGTKLFWAPLDCNVVPGGNIDFFTAQRWLVDQLISLYQSLAGMAPRDRLLHYRSVLAAIEFPAGVTLPCTPETPLTGFVPDKCKIVDSKRYPLWLVVRTVDGQNMVAMFKNNRNSRASLSVDMQNWGEVPRRQRLGESYSIEEIFKEALPLRNFGGRYSLQGMREHLGGDEECRERSGERFVEGVARLCYTFLGANGVSEHDLMVQRGTGRVFNIGDFLFRQLPKKGHFIRRTIPSLPVTPQMMGHMGSNFKEKYKEELLKISESEAERIYMELIGRGSAAGVELDVLDDVDLISPSTMTKIIETPIYPPGSCLHIRAH